MKQKPTWIKWSDEPPGDFALIDIYCPPDETSTTAWICPCITPERSDFIFNKKKAYWRITTVDIPNNEQLKKSIEFYSTFDEDWDVANIDKSDKEWITEVIDMADYAIENISATRDGLKKFLES